MLIRPHGPILAAVSQNVSSVVFILQCFMLQWSVRPPVNAFKLITVDAVDVVVQVTAWWR